MYNPNTPAFIPSKSSFTDLPVQVNNNATRSLPKPTATKKNKQGAKAYKREPRGMPKEDRALANLSLSVEEEIQRGNFRARGRKAQISINHLLDFSLPDREVVPTAQRTRRRSSNHERLNLHGDAFINANYKFIVDGSLSHSASLMDSNVLPEGVLRVVMPQGDSCPICLTEHLIAPRMISCGHLFCYTCLLSFMESSKEKHKECPLCANVLRKTVREVMLEPKTEPPVAGQEVTMKLMSRLRNGGAVALPVALGTRSDFPWWDEPGVQSAKVLRGGLSFVLDQYQQELSAIAVQHEIDSALYGDDGKYVRKATALIEEAMQSAVERFKEEVPLDNLSLSEGETYLYYEALCGSSTRYVLSSLDCKVLLTKYGDYSCWPEEINVKVESVHFGTQITESTLKRYKYLSHLPMGTELALMELDWRGDDVYSQFGSELGARRKKTTSKAKKEDRNKKRYEDELEIKNMEFYKEEGNESWVVQEEVSSELAFPESQPVVAESLAETHKKTQTVWGTHIPKNEEDDEWEKELMRQAEANKTKGRGRKKKMTLLSSTNMRG